VLRWKIQTNIWGGGLNVRKSRASRAPLLDEIESQVLVPGHEYPKMEGDHLYGGTDMHRCFAMYLFNPCCRVHMAWDK